MSSGRMNRNELSLKNVTCQQLLFGQPNPFDIPHIINEIVSYMSFEELKNCRSISRQWNVEACKYLYPKNEVDLQTYDELKSYFRRYRHRPEFCRHFHFRSKLNLEMRYVQLFFTELGPHIKSLRLQKIRWTDALLHELIFNKLPNLEELTFEFEENEWDPSERRSIFRENKIKTLPNLKKLCLRVEDPFEGVLLTRDFILAAPNLLELSSKVKDSNTQEDWNWLQSQGRIEVLDMDDVPPVPVLGPLQLRGFDFFDIILAGVVFYEIRPDAAVVEGHSAALRKLEKFDLKIKYNSNILNRLMAKEFPLKYLDMPCVVPDVTLENFNNFLKSLRNTLVHLKVKFESQATCNTDFSSSMYLQHLKHLSFDGFKGSLSFVKNLDHLESLTLTKLNFSRAFAQSDFDLSQPHHLKKLHVLYDTGKKCSVATAEGVALLFPDLKDLKLENLTDASLRVILSALPNLEMLSLMDCVFTDSGITGVTSENCEILAEKLNDNVVLNDYRVGRMRSFPWIGDLTRLRVLEMGSPKMTDLSIIYGAMRCKGIRRLVLMSYGVTDISFLKLVNEMDLHYLETRLCNQLTVPAVEYAKEKLKSREYSLNEYRVPTNLFHFMERYSSPKVHVKKPTTDRATQTD